MWQRCGVCDGDVILAVDNHSLENTLSCSIALVEHLIRKAKRPLLLRFRRTTQPPTSTSTQSDVPSGPHLINTYSKKEEMEFVQIKPSNAKPHVSLSVTLNVGEVSILLLHDHKLFVFVELRDVATVCRSGDRSKANGNEMVASISINKIFVLDLTPQGLKHRDVLRPAESISGPMISIEFNSTDVKTDLKVPRFSSSYLLKKHEHSQYLISGRRDRP